MTSSHASRSFFSSSKPIKYLVEKYENKSRRLESTNKWNTLKQFNTDYTVIAIRMSYYVDFREVISQNINTTGF